MHRRLLGPGAPAVTAVGYGGMHLSIEGRPPEEQSLRVLRAALDAGVTLIDTADVYCIDQHDIGHNERLIAQALAALGGRPRECHWWPPRAVSSGPPVAGTPTPGPSSSGQPCERSLRALGVERLRSLPAPRTRPQRAVGRQRRRAGAASRGGQAPVDRAVQREPAPDSRGAGHHPHHLGAEPPESVFPGVAVGGVVAYCAEQGIGFLAYSPTGGGRLNENAACASRAACRSPGASGVRRMRWYSPGRWRSRLR